jgi:hypothetical protein
VLVTMRPRPSRAKFDKPAVKIIFQVTQTIRVVHASSVGLAFVWDLDEAHQDTCATVILIDAGEAAGSTRASPTSRAPNAARSQAPRPHSPPASEPPWPTGRGGPSPGRRLEVRVGV